MSTYTYNVNSENFSAWVKQIYKIFHDLYSFFQYLPVLEKVE